MTTNYKAQIELLIEDYERKNRIANDELNNLDESFSVENDTITKRMRLITKKYCYQAFISELNRIIS